MSRYRTRNSSGSSSWFFQYQSLEARQLLAGNLQVTFRGDALSIVGDGSDNELSIVTQSTGQTTITGINTTINDGSQPFVITGSIKKLLARLNDGNDQCTVNGLQLSQQLQWYGGDGNDVLRMQNVTAKSCKIDLGSGHNTLDVDGMQTQKQTDIKARRGDNVIALNDLVTGRDTKVRLGDGNDTITTQALQVGRKLQLDLGTGNNTATLAGGNVSGDLQVRTGSGQDQIALMPERMGANLTIAKSIKVDLGRGDDQLSVDPAVSVGKSASLRGGSGQNVLRQSADLGEVRTSQKQWTDGSRSLENPIVHAVVAELRSHQINSQPFGGVQLTMEPTTQLVDVDDPSPTISVLWDRAAQAAVIAERTGPTIASRAYGMVHTAIYDAWSAYDPEARSTVLADDLQRPQAENTEANKQQAMSYAAYRVLVDLFPSRTEIFSAVMNRFGYDPNFIATTTTPAGIGNQMAAALLTARHADGSNQLGTDAAGTAGVRYSDNSGYTPINQAGQVVDLERWTAERVPVDAIPGEELRVQKYLTPHWGNVETFGLESGAQFRPTAPAPFLLVEGSVDLTAKTITTSDNQVHAISRDLIGTIINPAFIEQAEQVVDLSANLTEKEKLIAEFWEDAGGTSFPPGTSMTFGRYVSARDNHSLDEDAQLFLGLGNAVMNAGIATWEAKRFYDYTRPVRAIRELGRLGLIGEFDAGQNGYVIEAWVPGRGVQTILAEDFITYQTPGGDPSPPFAEYTSGHSAFSAAAAAVLREYTGSDAFGGFVTFEPGQSRFESGLVPTQTIVLEWPTFTVAALEAGMSRLYGGIHFMDGNTQGTQLGTQVGQATWDYAERLIRGLSV